MCGGGGGLGSACVVGPNPIASASCCFVCVVCPAQANYTLLSSLNLDELEVLANDVDALTAPPGGAV